MRNSSSNKFFRYDNPDLILKGKLKISPGGVHLPDKPLSNSFGSNPCAPILSTGLRPKLTFNLPTLFVILHTCLATISLLSTVVCSQQSGFFVFQKLDINSSWFSGLDTWFIFLLQFNASFQHLAFQLPTLSIFSLKFFTQIIFIRKDYFTLAPKSTAPCRTMFTVQLFYFLDAIASPSTYPCE